MTRFGSWRAAAAAGLAVPVALTTFLSESAAAATPPAPVSNVQASSQNADYIYLTWTPSPSTSSANACYEPGSTAPASPTDPGVTCLGVSTSPGGSFQGTDGQDYSISVFSYDTSTATYGQPASVTNVVATDVPPPAPDHVRSSAGGTTTVYLSWQAPNVPDVKDYLVSWAAGTAVPGPPATEDSAHVTQGTFMGVNSLTPGAVYTFAVRARDVGGHVSDPAVLTASTRDTNLWAADDSTGKLQTTAINSTPAAASAAMPSVGGTRVAAIYNSTNVYLFASTPNGWSVSYLGGFTGARGPYVAAGPSATVVAWTANSGVYYRYRSSSTAKWGNVVRVMTRTGDRVAGVALDSKRHIHLLVVRTKGTGRGLWYVTNTSGRWTRTLIKGTAAGDIGALTRDPATNRIVIVDRHRTSTVETVRVAVLGASATKPSTFATWLSTKNRAVQWRPTSAAAYGGTISVAVQRASSPASSSDGPYVLTGSSASHRRAARVSGTTAQDSGLFVSMPTAKRAVFTWQRRNAAWDPGQLGVWSVGRSYSGTTKAWTFASPRHWSSTAYDRSVAAFIDTNGHTHVIYFTAAGDVTE